MLWALPALAADDRATPSETPEPHASNPQASGSQRCLEISGTADGIDKAAALEASRQSLNDAVKTWQAQNHVSHFQETPWKPDPKPYWRSHVAPAIMLKPDEVTDQVYTICWPGVISPVVCTSGSRVCY